MKITTKDLCNELQKLSSTEWAFVLNSRKTAQFVSMATIPLREGKNLHTLQINWYNENLTPSQMQSVFDNLDWAEAYKESIEIHVYKNNEWIKTNQHICTNHDINYSFAIPKTIQTIIERKLDKIKSTDDGRGGK